MPDDISTWTSKYSWIKQRPGFILFKNKPSHLKPSLKSRDSSVTYSSSMVYKPTVTSLSNNLSNCAKITDLSRDTWLRLLIISAQCSSKTNSTLMPSSKSKKLSSSARKILLLEKMLSLNFSKPRLLRKLAMWWKVLKLFVRLMKKELFKRFRMIPWLFFGKLNLLHRERSSKCSKIKSVNSFLT